MYLTSFRSLWNSQTFLENSNSTWENSHRKHYELRNSSANYKEFIINSFSLAWPFIMCCKKRKLLVRCRARDWRHLFAITRCRYIEVFFQIFYTVTGVRKIVSTTEEFYIDSFVIIEVPLQTNINLVPRSHSVLH